MKYILNRLDSFEAKQKNVFSHKTEQLKVRTNFLLSSFIVPLTLGLMAVEKKVFCIQKICIHSSIHCCNFNLQWTSAVTGISRVFLLG